MIIFTEYRKWIIFYIVVTLLVRDLPRVLTCIEMGVLRWLE